VTVLEVYGHLFFAGARTLERLLPAPDEAESPVVILRLRGRTQFRATLTDVLARYADQLHAAQGRLYLSGIGADVRDQVAHSGQLLLTGPVLVYEATPIVGQATRRAYADAQTWLVGRAAEAAPDRAGPDGAAR
jgi:SulP family sulfate permease